MIVVDANVILASLIDSDVSHLARRAFRRDRVWVAPTLWRAEVLNALVTLIGKREMTRRDAEQVWRHADRWLEVKHREVDGLRVLRLAALYGISAYDAHYVALADALQVPLVTNDVKSLASKCPDSLVIRLTTFASR